MIADLTAAVVLIAQAQAPIGQKITGGIEYLVNFLIPYIILLALALATLRDILAKFDVWPHNWILANWIYHKHAAAPSDKDAKSRFDRPDRPFSTLVDLIKRYNYHSKRINHGIKTPTESAFYIDTMEAAQDPQELVLMGNLLIELIAKEIRIANHSTPDFVIIPKGGNPLLGQHVAQQLKAIVLLAKAKEDSAYVRVADDHSAEFRINFEGAERLLKLIAQKEAKGEKVHGICVDCNAMGGRSLREAVDSFNQLSQRLKLTIDHVSHVFILFRATNEKAADFDESFKKIGAAVYRYCDLSEEAKERLNAMQYSDPYSKGGRDAITAYLRFLIEQNLLVGHINTNELR